MFVLPVPLIYFFYSSSFFLFFFFFFYLCHFLQAKRQIKPSFPLYLLHNQHPFHMFSQG